MKPKISLTYNDVENDARKERQRMGTLYLEGQNLLGLYTFIFLASECRQCNDATLRMGTLMQGDLGLTAHSGTPDSSFQL